MPGTGMLGGDGQSKAPGQRRSLAPHLFDRQQIVLARRQRSRRCLCDQCLDGVSSQVRRPALGLGGGREDQGFVGEEAMTTTDDLCREARAEKIRTRRKKEREKVKANRMSAA